MMNRFVQELPTRAKRLLAYWMTLDYNENHAPPGSPNGGQFVSKNGGSSGGTESKSKNTSVRSAPKDVTSEYKYSATPGKGMMIVEPGVDRDKETNEINMAQWIHQTFGGTIKVCKKTHEDSPDYEWRGDLWELKTPISASKMDDRIRKGLEQIGSRARDRDPGGLILDLSKCNASIGDAIKAVGKRSRISGNFDFDTIIIHKNGEYRVIRTKKKRSD